MIVLALYFLSFVLSISILSNTIIALAVPSDEDTVILKTWVLPIPAYENNSLFGISSSFSGSEVYFIESNSNKIGRLVPTTNTITEWTIPTNASLPTSITVDVSTGNVYFIESNSNKIGRLVPTTNTITEWTIPTNASLPTSITVDVSTGNVYFIESNSNKIGRLVPTTNTITEWTIPTNASSAHIY